MECTLNDTLTARQKTTIEEVTYLFDQMDYYGRGLVLEIANVVEDFIHEGRPKPTNYYANYYTIIMLSKFFINFAKLRQLKIVHK